MHPASTMLPRDPAKPPKLIQTEPQVTHLAPKAAPKLCRWPQGSTKADHCTPKVPRELESSQLMCTSAAKPKCLPSWAYIGGPRI